MVTVNIQYKCDKCGKVKIEKPIIMPKGYEEVHYFIEDNDSAYMPDGWTTDYNELWCDDCNDDKLSNDSIVVA